MKKVCAVTGAGRGIGLAIAKHFSKDMTVIIYGRTQSKIDIAVAEIRASGADAYGMSCDVSDMDSIKMFADCAAKLGDIQMVINAAGISPGSGADAKSIFGVNMIGTVNITTAFYPLLAEGGILINIASMSAYMFPVNDAFTSLCNAHKSPDLLNIALEAFPNAGYAYPVSKRFVIEYTKICCPLFAKKGARVVSISPGVVDTPLLGTSKDSENVKDMITRTPIGRMSEPEEYGYLAEFLASDKAGCITGIDILVDGGYMAVFGNK
jgi:Dehydrogenases with different specificities (related to short-chain alcohol dehydrogenases)